MAVAAIPSIAVLPAETGFILEALNRFGSLKFRTKLQQQYKNQTYPLTHSQTSSSISNLDYQRAEQKMAELDQHPQPHAILFPYPLQGHVIPFVNLAIKLASIYQFKITIINTESVHQQILMAKGKATSNEQQQRFDQATKSGLQIRYATVSDGFPLNFDRSLHHDEFFEGILQSFSCYVDEIVGKLIAEDPTINCLIADTFYVWTSTIAHKYNLANVSFFTEPALVLTLYYHMELLIQNGHFGSKKNREDAIEYIPGVKSIKPTDLMSYLQETETLSSTVHRILYRAFGDVKNSDFILCNTIQELEQETISALQKEQPLYAIGPIFPPGFTKSRISTSLWPESDCTQWLDTKPHGSVLYVSFGSYAHASKREIQEIAHGLLLSKVYFIWVLRPDIVSSEESNILPPGFDDLINGRGLIVQWCCQIEVISHPSVGGFLTHCGWNSILESIWAGVPLICYPLLTDQFTNRKLVVDDWKIGINLHGVGESMLSREEVAETTRVLMDGGKFGAEIRVEVKKVRMILENATAIDGGSSVGNLERFVEQLKEKIGNTRKGS